MGNESAEGTRKSHKYLK